MELISPRIMYRTSTEEARISSSWGRRRGCIHEKNTYIFFLTLTAPPPELVIPPHLGSLKILFFLIFLSSSSSIDSSFLVNNYAQICLLLKTFHLFLMLVKLLHWPTFLNLPLIS